MRRNIREEREANKGLANLLLLVVGFVVLAQGAAEKLFSVLFF